MARIGDNWAAADAYERYMGRWTRPLSRAFVTWLAPRSGARWLDVGCGTGALASAIGKLASPAGVVACDPSEPFVAHARETDPGRRITYVVSRAEDLPADVRDVDYVVSALALNFMPDPAAGVRHMGGRLRSDGTVAACVWDYGEGLEFLRAFWDEAVALDPAAAALDEGRRFPICQPEALRGLFAGAGLRDVAVGALDVPTHFRGFSDYWQPFLTGTGPAPSYVTSLTQDERERLRDRLAARLVVGLEGTIRLMARAWVVRGTAG